MDFMLIRLVFLCFLSRLFFESDFLLRTPRSEGITTLRYPQQYLSTVSTAEEPEIGRAAVRSGRPDSRVRQRKQADNNKCCRERATIHEFCLFPFFSLCSLDRVLAIKSTCKYIFIFSKYRRPGFEDV